MPTKWLFRLSKGAAKALRAIGMNELGAALAARWPFPVWVDAPPYNGMYVDLRSAIGRAIFSKGHFDLAAFEPVLEALPVGGTFLDIGANIGFYSLLASARVGPIGKVFSFEMDPRSLKVFRKTITALELSNIQIVEAAVMDQDGSAAMIQTAELGHTRISYHANDPEVRTLKLDTWFQNKKTLRVNCMKIDVEGAEFQVLAGARELILRDKPLIVCEACPENAALLGNDIRSLLEQLRALGYETRWLPDVCTPTILAKPTSLSKPM